MLFLLINCFNVIGFNNCFFLVIISFLLLSNVLYILNVVVLKVIVFDNKIVVFLFNGI